ncbi:hypothetical protein PTKIN_Ptkin06aG0210800 [Pterospermum kingtungense]
MRDRLLTRGVDIPVFCYMCTREVESSWHVFLTCHCARKCLTEVNLQHLVDNFIPNADSFTDWVSLMLNGWYDVEACKVLEGEAIGILKALSWIYELGFKNVLFEFDSRGVVDAINSNVEDMSEFGTIIGYRRNLLQIEYGFSLHFIKRQANGCAHSFARHSYFYTSPHVWTSFPSFMDARLLNSCTVCA